MILGPVVLERQATTIAGVDMGTAITASAASAAFFTYILRILNNRPQPQQVSSLVKSINI